MVCIARLGLCDMQANMNFLNKLLMATSKFSDWYTSYDQANKTMTHEFVNGIKSIVSWGKCTITITRYAETIDTFPFGNGSYTIDDHGEILLKISKIAHARYFLGDLFNTRKRKLKKIRHELPCL